MYKVMIATLLAAGLRAAPLPPHSFAAFAQQSRASEKAAKRKKGQAPASSPRVNARRNAQLSGKKRKPPAKLKRGTTWPKFWSDCNKRLKAAAK